MTILSASYSAYAASAGALAKPDDGNICPPDVYLPLNRSCGVPLKSAPDVSHDVVLTHLGTTSDGQAKLLLLLIALHHLQVFMRPASYSLERIGSVRGTSQVDRNRSIARSRFSVCTKQAQAGCCTQLPHLSFESFIHVIHACNGMSINANANIGTWSDHLTTKSNALQQLLLPVQARLLANALRTMDSSVVQYKTISAFQPLALEFLDKAATGS